MSLLIWCKCKSIIVPPCSELQWWNAIDLAKNHYLPFLFKSTWNTTGVMWLKKDLWYTILHYTISLSLLALPIRGWHSASPAYLFGMCFTLNVPYYILIQKKTWYIIDVNTTTMFKLLNILPLLLIIIIVINKQQE